MARKKLHQKMALHQVNPRLAKSLYITVYTSRFLGILIITPKDAENKYLVLKFTGELKFKLKRTFLASV